jgi:periplasmic divalent cation tolerance protein
MSALIVFITASSRKEADRLAQALVKEKWAACVSIVPEIYSRYWWQGRIENDVELLLVAKTLKSKFKGLVRRVKELHSYTVPEVLALPIVQGNPAYLKWMKDSLSVSKRAAS